MICYKTSSAELVLGPFATMEPRGAFIGVGHLGGVHPYVSRTSQMDGSMHDKQEVLFAPSCNGGGCLTSLGLVCVCITSTVDTVCGEPKQSKG